MLLSRMLISAVETVITFATAKEKDDNDGEVWKQGDLRNNIYRDINGDYAQQCYDPFDFAALAVLVSSLGIDTISVLC